MTTPENTITYHNALSLSPKTFAEALIVFSFSWGHFNSQEKLKTLSMQNFGVTNKEHYDMLWYFLEWSIYSTWVKMFYGLKTSMEKDRPLFHDL